MLAGQSDPLFELAKLLITTPTPSLEIPAQEILLQKDKERVQMLPQPNRLLKICTDAGFLKTVEVGHYFMTKHTDEFLQFAEPVTCREYTKPRDEKSSDPKGWIGRRQNFISETLHAWASSEDRSQECVEIEAATATAAARYTKRQQETACGALPGKPTPKRYLETIFGGRA